MSDKVRSAIWPHEGVGYYPDIAFPYNLFTAPTVCSRAGRQIQGIRIRLGLESRRHASNAQCIYSLLINGILSAVGPNELHLEVTEEVVRAHHRGRPHSKIQNLTGVFGFISYENIVYRHKT